VFLSNELVTHVVTELVNDGGMQILRRADRPMSSDDRASYITEVLLKVAHDVGIQLLRRIEDRMQLLQRADGLLSSSEDKLASSSDDGGMYSVTKWKEVNDLLKLANGVGMQLLWRADRLVSSSYDHATNIIVKPNMMMDVYMQSLRQTDGLTSSSDVRMTSIRSKMDVTYVRKEHGRSFVEGQSSESISQNSESNSCGEANNSSNRSSESNNGELFIDDGGDENDLFGGSDDEDDQTSRDNEGGEEEDNEEKEDWDDWEIISLCKHRLL
jgi:hypothetical protein